MEDQIIGNNIKGEEHQRKKVKIDQTTVPEAQSVERFAVSNSAKIRKFKKIPIFIVEYHNDVLELIYRCFGSRHLPIFGNLLIHFDSHPDMVISRDVKPDTVFNKVELFENLSIENWIMPACYAGHFKTLIWLKNTWCKQIDCGKYNFSIGDYNGEILVDFKTPYFISEGNYIKNAKLNNKKEIQLSVLEFDENDSKNQNDFENILNLINSSNGYYILDIDLDYFSTANPFLNIYEKIDCYKKVCEIFDYNIDEINFDFDYEKRRIQIENLKQIFLYLDKNRKINDDHELILENNVEIIGKILELIKLLQKYYKDEEIDWILIYNAGCTSDNNGLPHHISSDEQLKNYFNNFKKILNYLKGKPPTIVTISRSTEDGYCPLDKIEFIQESVIEILKTCFGELNINCESPILWYKNADFDSLENLIKS